MSDSATLQDFIPSNLMKEVIQKVKPQHWTLTETKVEMKPTQYQKYISKGIHPSKIPERIFTLKLKASEYSYDVLHEMTQIIEVIKDIERSCLLVDCVAMIDVNFDGLLYDKKEIDKGKNIRNAIVIENPYFREYYKTKETEDESKKVFATKTEALWWLIKGETISVSNLCTLESKNKKE